MTPRVDAADFCPARVVWWTGVVARLMLHAWGSWGLAGGSLGVIGEGAGWS